MFNNFHQKPGPTLTADCLFASYLNLRTEWSNVHLLTCNDPSREEELADGLGKGTGGHSEPTQDSTQHDRPSAAEPLHQHATEGTCGPGGMLLLKTQSRNVAKTCS